ncbi:MAG TPA: hypothetical protein VFC78_10210 [Tepidisphaeraceae bacterium]|nr:hypothetical protein [Tepidisphaeraceae bacterium]
MTTLASLLPLTPEDVERASERDARRYELIDGEMKEKNEPLLPGFRLVVDEAFPTAGAGKS